MFVDTKKPVYEIFASNQYDNPAVLEMSRLRGITFCSKSYHPVKGTGIYKIVHEGLDKNKKPFRIAEPVLDITAASMTTRHWLDMIRSNGDIHLTGMHASSYSRRFSAAADINPDTEIAIDHVGEYLRTHTMKDLNTVIETPLDFSECDFEIDTEPVGRVRPANQIFIVYTNGEVEWQSASWIYKNRDRLLNCSITVYGNTADTLCMEFHKVNKEAG